jgi:hypothetical protein
VPPWAAGGVFLPTSGLPVVASVHSAVMAATTTRRVGFAKGGTPERSGKRSNLWQRTQRARTIAVERARVGKGGRAAPVPWRTIASRHGITARQAERIYVEFCAWELSQADPLRTVDESILLREALLDQLGEIAVAGDSSSAQVGASKAMLDVDRDRLQLMQAVGRVPRNLRRHQADVEFVTIVDEILDLLERRGVEREALKDIQAIVRAHIDAPAIEGNVTMLPVGKTRGKRP